MNYLLDGVHTSIGAPGTDEFDSMIGDETQCLLEILLHRIAVRLALPATIGGPAILDTHCIFHSFDPGPDSLSSQTGISGLLRAKNKVIRLFSSANSDDEEIPMW